MNVHYVATSMVKTCYDSKKVTLGAKALSHHLIMHYLGVLLNVMHNWYLIHNQSRDIIIVGASIKHALKSSLTFLFRAKVAILKYDDL